MSAEREPEAAPAPLQARCLVCGRAGPDPFVRLESMPVHTNVLWPTPDEARSATRADIALSLCDACGLIWNTRFDPAVVAYDAEYENSLEFSGEFRRYSDELIERLVSRHRLDGRHVAEVGSGMGAFLAALCERAGCSGIGFDPSYAGEADGRARGRLTFVRDLLRAESDLGRPELVVSRHVVEHLEDPVAVLAGVRRALGDDDAVLYVEVPAAEYLLDEDAVWDVIYPHVTCLSAPALHEILVRAGFQPTEYGYSFGGQYLWVEATTNAAETRSIAPPAAGLADRIGGFAERFAAKQADWAVRLPQLVERGAVALWGAGAKGTMFLNLVPGGDAIRHVVDVNPRKQGKYVPGTGQRIVAPEELRAVDLGAVVVMNPIYRDEIAATLAELELDAELIVA
jgi:SAM-dependent methyltransferase